MLLILYCVTIQMKAIEHYVFYAVQDGSNLWIQNVAIQACKFES